MTFKQNVRFFISKIVDSTYVKYAYTDPRSV